MKIESANKLDGESLAELRISSMRESLEAIGRFERDRARQRFLSAFQPESTWKIIIDDELAGFYVFTELPDYLHIDHLYVHPNYQGKKIGSQVLAKIIGIGRSASKSIKLGALKGSRSNQFYMSHKFIKVGESEFDNYYEFTHC